MYVVQQTRFSQLAGLAHLLAKEDFFFSATGYLLPLQSSMASILRQNFHELLELERTIWN